MAVSQQKLEIWGMVLKLVHLLLIAPIKVTNGTYHDQELVGGRKGSEDWFERFKIAC